MNFGVPKIASNKFPVSYENLMHKCVGAELFKPLMFTFDNYIREKRA
jgi:hypothetical protein